MTKNTFGNNDFQAALINMMRDCGMTTNSRLTLASTSDDIVIIRKTDNNKAVIIDSNAPQRFKVHLHNDYDRQHEFVSLTADQMRLLEWLQDECILNEDWGFSTVDDIDFEKI